MCPAHKEKHDNACQKDCAGHCGYYNDDCRPDVQDTMSESADHCGGVSDSQCDTCGVEVCTDCAYLRNRHTSTFDRSTVCAKCGEEDRQERRRYGGGEDSDSSDSDHSW